MDIPLFLWRHTAYFWDTLSSYVINFTYLNIIFFVLKLIRFVYLRCCILAVLRRAAVVVVVVVVGLPSRLQEGGRMCSCWRHAPRPPILLHCEGGGGGKAECIIYTARTISTLFWPSEWVQESSLRTFSHCKDLGGQRRLAVIFSNKLFWAVDLFFGRLYKNDKFIQNY